MCCSVARVKIVYPSLQVNLIDALAHNMMNIKYIIIVLFLPLRLMAQLTGSAMWDSVRAEAEPKLTVEFEAVYEQPERLALSDYGWEDGLQVSADGLHLYALYAPADLLSWFTYINAHPDLPICETLGNMEFMRSYANDYGMDMATNFFRNPPIVNYGSNVIIFVRSFQGTTTATTTTTTRG